MSISKSCLLKLRYDQNITEILNCDVNTLFNIRQSAGDGNCLYISLSNSLKENVETKMSHTEIRSRVADWYADALSDAKRLGVEFMKYVDTIVPKPDRTLAFYTAAEFVNNIREDDDSTADMRDHIAKIHRVGEWGEATDVMVAAVVLRRNIIIISTNTHGSRNDRCYITRYFASHDRTEPPLWLLYSGNSHYDYLVPKHNV